MIPCHIHVKSNWISVCKSGPKDTVMMHVVTVIFQVTALAKQFDKNAHFGLEFLNCFRHPDPIALLRGHWNINLHISPGGHVDCVLRSEHDVVVRIGKVLVATRAHLSYMELMVVLSFSGLRAVVTFFS